MDLPPGRIRVNSGLRYRVTMTNIYEVHICLRFRVNIRERVGEREKWQYITHLFTFKLPSAQKQSIYYEENGNIQLEDELNTRQEQDISCLIYSLFNVYYHEYSVIGFSLCLYFYSTFINNLT